MTNHSSDRSDPSIPTDGKAEPRMNERQPHPDPTDEIAYSRCYFKTAGNEGIHPQLGFAIRGSSAIHSND